MFNCHDKKFGFASPFEDKEEDQPKSCLLA